MKDYYSMLSTSFLLPSFQLLPALLLTHYPLAASAGETAWVSASVSITDYTSYAIAPACVTSCLWGKLRPGLIYTNDLPNALGCGSQWAYNGCFCRTDYSSPANSFLSSCVSTKCVSVPGGINEQVSSAEALYGGYCEKGRTQDTAPTPTAGSAPASRPSSQPKQTSTANSNPSGADPNQSPASSSSQQPDKKIMGLSMGAFIGVIVSILCSVIGLAFGIGFKVYKYKKEKRRRTEMHEGPVGVYHTTKR